MFKSLLITCLLAIITLTTVHAQNLKVSAVDASDTKIYNEVAPKYLGKVMQLTIYDNSVTVKVAKVDPINLRLTSDNDYSMVESDSEHESHTFYLTINKTLCVITSATLKYVIREKGGQYRTADFTLTAKRF